MTSSPSSEGGQQGIAVKLRVLCSGAPEQRFDVHGAELLQFRASVVDSHHHHPPLVVRFGGQRRNDLWRWVKPGKHLSIEGSLEVKTYQSGGHTKVALLIEAQSIYQLTDVTDLGKVGIYTTAGRMAEVKPAATKAERADQVRMLLDKD